MVAPYERFLETERTKLENGLEAMRGAQAEVAALEHRIAETFPEEAALRPANASGSVADAVSPRASVDDAVSPRAS